MGEKSILAIAKALNEGIPISEIHDIRGTVYRTKELPKGVLLPSYEELCRDKKAYAESFRIQYENMDPFTGKALAEPYDKQGYLVQNPPSKPLTQQEMDEVYDLPYTRTYHPMYEKMGKIPAIEEIKFSLTSNRGCFGGCNFCALAFHQGRIVQTRAMSPLWRRLSCAQRKRILRDISTMLGGPQQISAIPPAKNR